jgi:hypothetical protein
MRASFLLLAISIWIATSAVAEQSSTLVKNDIVGQYQMMKRTYEKEYPSSSSSRPNRKEVYDLVDCIGADPALTTKDKLTHDIAVLAAEIVDASRMLAWVGYPPSLWQTAINDYEKGQLDRISSGKGFSADIEKRAAQSLLKVLDAERTESKPPLAKVAWETDCGGQGIEVKITTLPRGGTIRILPALYYSFCKAQGVNAETIKECNRWDEIADGAVLLLSGAYWFQANWRSGPTTEGRKDTSRISDGQWIVRQPGG